jgi:hypothetical protein
MCSRLPGEDSDGSGDARVASAVREIPPIPVRIPEKVVNTSYAQNLLATEDDIYTQTK